MFATRFSALFPDVVNCMQTDNVELKKLVYLYLMNYAKSQPDLAIMAVNTFVKVILFPQKNADILSLVSIYFHLKDLSNNVIKRKFRKLFLQDCEDPNPLIRALAVRTMGCIRVDKVNPSFLICR